MKCMAITLTLGVLLAFSPVLGQATPPSPREAAQTVPEGGAGFYTLARTSLSVAADEPAPVTLRAVVHRDQSDQPPAVLAVLAAGDTFTFDCFLGYLNPGDRVTVTLRSESGPVRPQTRFAWSLEPVAPIPVLRVAADASDAFATRAQLLTGVAANSPQARRLALQNPEHAGKLQPAGNAGVSIPLGREPGVEQVLAIRLPQSGYYALHDASARATDHPATLRVYRHDDADPLATVALPAGQRVAIGRDLGYLAKGQLLYLAFASERGGGAVEVAASLVEWAPRRPPIRVVRGGNGYLDVIEPQQPDRRTRIPADRWVEVPATDGDATKVLREAIAAARARAADGAYAGVRLASGKTYVVASGQTGGSVFEIRDAHRLVIDGNGATVAVNSPDSQREGIRLFNVAGSSDIVFTDLVVDSKTPPAYAIGEVLAVSPMKNGNQTVTFRTLPGSADPLADIARGGGAAGYAYDPAIPGRIAHNAWAHYPGASVKPQIKATDQPGVFEHTVTRTDSTIQPGSRWLIKNKKAGVWYVVTDSTTQNVTLNRLTALAAGGGLLRFWQTSGVSVLDCRIEPQGEHWISSTSDGIHGRGREAVWIENTLLRGICEDILNIYGPTMVVVANPKAPTDGRVLNIQQLARAADGSNLARPAADNMLAVGDSLFFLNPRTGKTLGEANILAIDDGLVTLSQSIPGIDTWEPGDAATSTTVYNPSLAARFFIRDSRFMDSMRFGAFIKARGGVIFNTHFEGLPASAIYAANEPEYPEGPPPSYLWLQGNTFSQNNFGYNSRSRTHLQADPADVSIFTRRLRDTSAAQPFLGSTVRGEYSTSHMKVIGNVFHDWRGMGIAARNVRNLHVIGNLFLSPLEDAGLRKTLAADPANSADGAGLFTGIFLDSVAGGRVADNTLVTPDATTRLLGEGANVRGIEASNNRTLPASARPDELRFDFAEWFGPRSTSRCGGVHLELSNVRRGVGQLGAGLWFAGDGAATTPPTGPIAEPTRRCTIALWVKPTSPAAGQILLARTSEEGGLVLLLDGQRLRAGVWSRGVEEWIDLGPAFQNAWQHVAVTYDGQARRFSGYVNGRKIASATSAPESLPAATDPIRLGSPTPRTRTGPSAKPAPGPAAFHGGLDELRISPAALDEPDPSAVLHANR